MKKSWKFKVVDLFLRLYTRSKGLEISRETFTAEQQFNNIVIYSTTALGDFLMNTPAIRAVRQRFPNALITLVIHRKFEGFIDGGKDWDRVVYWNSKVKTVPDLLKELKVKGKPDLALILHSHEPYDYLSAVMSGASYIFRDNYFDNIPSRDRWLTNYVYGFKGHLIQRKLELVAPLGCDISNVEMKLPYSPAPRIAKTRNKRVIGFQMGASTPERCWPVEYFARVASALLKNNPDIYVVLIGGAGEKHLHQPFLENVDTALHGRIENLIGETTLLQLVDNINNFDLLLTGDTGPLHIAVALKVPTLSLFVTAEPDSTGPYQNRDIHRVLYGVRMAIKSESLTDEAMKTIEPGEVIDCLYDDFKIICNSNN